MKIICLTRWFSEAMGYAENMLPKALAKTGRVEVHVVSSNTQIAYNSPGYKQIYESFLGPSVVDIGIVQTNGFTLHRLPFYETKKKHRGPGISDLYKYLESLKPEIIQTFEIDLEITYIAARYCQSNPCKLFTECHVHASIFMNRKNRIKSAVGFFWKNFSNTLGIINNNTSLCYPIAPDVQEIAVSYYKVPRNKIRLQPLGVDTEFFHPPQNNDECRDRDELRKRLGFSESDIICIYTGRFSEDKNPHCLAKGINYLQDKGLPFKGIFIGNGSESDINFIKSMKGCDVQRFMPVHELPHYYRAADIGVWPREESTSQLDAMACGLPLILSDKIKVIERIYGNGLAYKESDFLDLAHKLVELSNPEKRKQMAAVGIQKIMKDFSWDSIAENRINDYKSFLG